MPDVSAISPIERVAAVRRTRAAAATAALDVFRADGFGVSERELCRRWADGLTADPALLPGGWYAPPPGGLSVLAGDPPDYDRTRYVSLRHENTWPSADRLVGPESVVYAYASPVDRRTMMIGDLGFTIYRGDDPAIRDHIAECFDITSRVARFAAVGMELRELYDYATALIRQAGMANETYSATDVTGGLDIGHTVPWTYRDPTEDEVEALSSNDHGRIASAISQARVFLNSLETQRIKPTMALTIEPRMTAPGRPLVSFHVIVTFVDGVKDVRVDFEPILRAHEMINYLAPDSLDRLTT